MTGQLTDTARAVLERGLASYTPYQQPSGELHDPVFGQPTQYGTPYHAFGHAVLAGTAAGAERDAAVDRAARGTAAALAHLLDLDEPATAAGFDRLTGSVRRGNHRDFFWPPVLKSYRLLRDLGSPGAPHLADRTARVDIARAFRSRPPSNWAAVWLSGEWVRIREGLSPHTVTDVDGWLEPFFAERIRIEQGLYEEPGHPNSYDLFTRYHLADLIFEGYDGRHRGDLERLLTAGLRRSLDVQLSDGSLASAHRSTGQTWTVGAQCAFFTRAARFLADRDPDLARQAAAAATRALGSFARWQRPDGPYSPVENRLPPAYRVGYEGYTADGHYGSLALGFLAVAVLAGLDDLIDLYHLGWADPGPPAVRVDHDPVHRVIARRGPYSVHANGWPAPGYDAFGIVDVTFGPGRWFHLVSSARHLATGRPTNLGLAYREDAELSAPTILSQADLMLTAPIATFDDPPGFELHARARGQAHGYRLRVAIEDDGVRVVEGTPGLVRYPTLLVPYPRDPGTGTVTEVQVDGRHVRFRHGAERITVRLDGTVDRVLDLPYGWESRRGLAGMVRVDLADPAAEISYRLSVER